MPLREMGPSDRAIAQTKRTVGLASVTVVLLCRHEAWQLLSTAAQSLQARFE